MHKCGKIWAKNGKQNLQLRLSQTSLKNVITSVLVAATAVAAIINSQRSPAVVHHQRHHHHYHYSTSPMLMLSFSCLCTTTSASASTVFSHYLWNRHSNTNVNINQHLTGRSSGHISWPSCFIVRIWTYFIEVVLKIIDGLAKNSHFGGT